MVLSSGLSEPYLQSFRIDVPNLPELSVRSSHCCCGTSNFLGTLFPRWTAQDCDSYVASGLLAAMGKTASRLHSGVCQSILDATSTRSPALPVDRLIF